MKYSLYPPVKRRLIDIWHYTDQNWGQRQADKYLKGMIEAIKRTAQDRALWRKVPHPQFPGIFFLPYQRHFIFFRQLSKNHIGIISILHEQQDIPNRLKEDVEKT